MSFVRAALVVLLLSVPQMTQANGTEDVRSAIEAVNMEFSAAFNRGDAAGVAELYTEDGSLLPPGENIVSGRSNIEAYWKAGVDAGLSNLQLTASEVEAHGPLAYEVGEFSFEMPGSDGGRTTAKGKYLVVWKNVDGTWKLHRDMWNDPPKQ
jgi:uncharacterized protein (TIGR02246 family)